MVWEVGGVVGVGAGVVHRLRKRERDEGWDRREKVVVRRKRERGIVLSIAELTF